MTIWVPGMRCVCVNAKSERGLPEGLDGLAEGVVYTVRAVGYGPADHPDRRLGLYLVEIVRPRRFFDTEEVPYATSRFRPLSETRLDQFRKHLNRIPADEVLA